LITEPDNAALAAAKIFGLNDENIRKAVVEYQETMREILERNDKEIQ